MLVDYISPERLPWVVVWLDWNAYAYWRSLVVCITLVCLHYFITWPYHTGRGLLLACFIGCALWVVYCAFRYGYAVG